MNGNFSFVANFTNPNERLDVEFNTADLQLAFEGRVIAAREIVYNANPEIPVAFAPFNCRDDMTTGVHYRNLYDTMVDAVITAIAVAGHENIPVVVAETGWPCSAAQPSEVDANQVYAEV